MKKPLIVFVATLTLACGAFADGVYQKTRDGKTTVWNSEPKPGDEATWSGARDNEGYAKGFGTLTWYSAEEHSGGRAGDSNRTNESPLFARYFGNMVRGKFDGPVNVHAKNRTHYAVFVEGERKTRWTAGAAPSRAWAQHRALVAANKPAAEPEAPAEGPPASTATKKIARAELVEPAATPKPAPPKTAERPPAPAAKPITPNESAKLPEKKEPAEADSSLQLLTGPPASLRNVPPPPAAEAETQQPRLTNAEVVDLAEGAARSHGINAGEFQRGDAQFNARDETWTLTYSAAVASDEGPKGFSVTVDDKTKGTVFVPAK